MEDTVYKQSIAKQRDSLINLIFQSCNVVKDYVYKSECNIIKCREKKQFEHDLD